MKTAGDVNGDGIDDLIVGAPQNTISGGTGGACVVFGGADIGTTPPTFATLDGSNGFRLAGEEAASQTAPP